MKARVLVFNGESDKMIPPEQVVAFKAEMTRAGASFRYVGYPGVRHSFTNPEADALAAKFKLPLAYDKEADRDSWAQTEQFFKEISRNRDSTMQKAGDIIVCCGACQEYRHDGDENKKRAPLTGRSRGRYARLSAGQEIQKEIDAPRSRAR